MVDVIIVEISWQHCDLIRRIFQFRGLSRNVQSPRGIQNKRANRENDVFRAISVRAFTFSSFHPQHKIKRREQHEAPWCTPSSFWSSPAFSFRRVPFLTHSNFGTGSFTNSRRLKSPRQLPQCLSASQQYHRPTVTPGWEYRNRC
jgi:hypothetical protein